MQTSPEVDSACVPEPAEDNHASWRAADRVYQGVTIAAMLLLLVSLWVF